MSVFVTKRNGVVDNFSIHSEHAQPLVDLLTHLVSLIGEDMENIKADNQIGVEALGTLIERKI